MKRNQLSSKKDFKKDVVKEEYKKDMDEEMKGDMKKKSSKMRKVLLEIIYLEKNLQQFQEKEDQLKMEDLLR